MRKRTKKERGKEGRTFAADGDAERLDEVKVGRLTEVRIKAMIGEAWHDFEKVRTPPSRPRPPPVRPRPSFRVHYSYNSAPVDFTTSHENLPEDRQGREGRPRLVVLRVFPTQDGAGQSVRPPLASFATLFTPSSPRASKTFSIVLSACAHWVPSLLTSPGECLSEFQDQTWP